jgi:hypothetical protein
MIHEVMALDHGGPDVAFIVPHLLVGAGARASLTLELR